MKDFDSPSTNDDNDVDRRQRDLSSSCALPPSGGEFRLSNGSTVVVDKGSGACRRRCASGGHCGVVNGSFSHLTAANGHLTAPHVEQPPAHPVVPPAPAGHGFAAAAELVGGGDGGAGSWAVPTRSQILRDVANLCTFTGAILATLAMACMWKGR